MSEARNISRRHFLQSSSGSLGALGVGAGSLSSLPSQAARPEREKVSAREARVLSFTRHGFDGPDYVGEMIERIGMAPYDVDIICLPEAFATTAKTPEEVPGIITQRLRPVANRLNCYIICPLHVRKEGGVFNTAVLMDRTGEVVGQYDKIHPVSSECEAGIVPGKTPPPVFKTDFGTIGIQICFDINWMEEWTSLKEQGAEIVFWTSAYVGGRNLSALAWIHKYYIVGCSRTRDPSQIYDISGDLIAESGAWEHWAHAVLNLEKEMVEIAFYSQRLRDMKRKYGDKVSIKYFHQEDWVTIESRSPELRISALLKEYEIMPHWDYIRQEKRLQDEYRG